MKTEDLVKAIRCCGSSPKLDRCKSECVFYAGGDFTKCIPVMAKAVADALEAVTAERDAAVKDIENHLKHEGYDCTMCAYEKGCRRNGVECERDAKWRGNGESNGI